ncbi:MAG: hypothetical protein A2Y03_09555 [Omnitrophica WOR_2 bacterium GWF2_38_59]|nr:MAG: hypothetical protein A2Y03_09555 [Omnitrophica WOR_2 bacterium GWF2_38_59]OGX49604.1 MAG: hypothetical protein A2243_11760 [Omnitrophica WOR_2 bacterium RIFOXYA2_FULL_38_17]OGX58886.1 MAG: hypothetical protein A2306_10860 [Omnitrophica WOR_2 bacterium RIFOXYB2_FULL_38_16]HBG61642.1 hypothetical protein [Candidatus Omnitrophota bacterium]
MTLNKSTRNSKAKTNIAFLRFKLDTLGENFIYEEATCFKNFSPFVFCGRIKRLDKKIDHYCCEEFINLQSKWLNIPQSQKIFYHKVILKYLRIISEKNIMILHAQFLTDAFFFHDLIKESKLPLIVTLRGYDLFHPKAQLFLQKLMPFVSKFIVKSESMKDVLASFGCNTDKVQVIYGGINTDRIIFRPRIPAENNINILSAGRFVDKKGYETTIIFFSKLLRSYPNAKLTLIGEGELKNFLSKLIKRLEISDNVIIKDFMPHLSFIKELYKYNLCVLPSRTAKKGYKEGIPNFLKEAMASGMPVISTFHSGIPELITDHETGYLVAENDHQGIFTKVKFILENKEKAFQACLNARFFVEKYFNVKKTAAKIERIYDYLLMPDYVRSAIDLNDGKKPTEFRVDLHLQKGCNSECIMCDNWKSHPSTSYSRKNVSEVLDQLQTFGVDQVRFHGQEPTLMKDIFSIIKEAKDKGFRVGLKTNALIFSDEKKVKMLSGVLDDLYLSIDSSDENIHNSMRGNDQSFSRNMLLIKALRKISTSMKIYLNSVITNVNHKHLIGLLDIAESMKIARVSFVHLSTNNKDNIKRLKLSKDQLKEFYFRIWPQILKKSISYNIPVSVDPYLTSLIELPVEQQIKILNNASTGFNEEIDNFFEGLYGKYFYGQNKCYGVLDHATIDWEGNVFPCCAMPRNQELAVGNIHKDIFVNIWNSDKYVKYRDDIIRGDCRFKDYCSRSFKKTAEYNNYFEIENKNAEEIAADFQDQYMEKSRTNKYSLEKLIYYSFCKSEVYHNKFQNFITPNKKLNLSHLPFITKDELKLDFPGKKVVPNYFDDEYGIYRTSSCGSAAFLYARPLSSNAFTRMSESFRQTGKWKSGCPWLKLTSLNCVESQYPLNIAPPVRSIENGRSKVTVIPASNDFINESRSKIKEVYSLINGSNAQLIHANPSYLKLLLYRFKQEKMKLDNNYVIHSTYELLLPSTKSIIEKYLNCKVFDQYGCSEIGPIAFKCSHGKNHIFSDTVHIEVLPDNKLNRSDVGRVIVTHLKNYVMPFVKYFTGDFAYFLDNKDCACGLKSPIMGDIAGRDNEIIYHKNKVVFPLELDSIFYNFNNILMYQAVFENGQFFVQIVPESKEKPIPVKKVINTFKTFFEDNSLEVHIETVASILPKRKGKYSSVIIK